MSTPPSPTAVATVRVPAGTTAMQALKEAGVPLKGPDGAVVVRDAAGELKDLNWAPDADAVRIVPADPESSARIAGVLDRRGAVAAGLEVVPE